MATERNMEKLAYYWEVWRDTSGKPARPYFLKYVDLMNAAATMEENGKPWIRKMYKLFY